MNLDPSLLIFGVGSVATIGGSFAVMKVTVADMKKDLKDHEKSDVDILVKTESRLSRLETLTQEIHRAVVKD